MPTPTTTKAGVGGMASGEVSAPTATTTATNPFGGGGVTIGTTYPDTTRGSPSVDLPPEAYYDPSKSWEEQRSGSSGGGGGGGGGGSATIGASYKEVFYNWMGRQPTSGELATMQKQGWVEDTMRRYAVAHNGTGPLMLQARDTLRQLAAPFYDGDPSAIPTSLVNTLISDGLYGDSAYLVNTYFPTLKGVGATNPLAADFVDAWTQMTGTSLTDAALSQLNTFVKAYGFTDTASAAWGSWVKQTNEAITGNYGATQRARSATLSPACSGVRLPPRSWHRSCLPPLPRPRPPRPPPLAPRLPLVPKSRRGLPTQPASWL